MRMFNLFKKRELLLWHPESPGAKVWVSRGLFKRVLYPKFFATITEAVRYEKELRLSIERSMERS